MALKSSNRVNWNAETVDRWNKAHKVGSRFVSDAYPDVVLVSSAHAALSGASATVQCSAPGVAVRYQVNLEDLGCIDQLPSWSDMYLSESSSGNFATFVVMLPLTTTKRTSLLSGVRDLVKASGGLITGSSAHDEMTISDLYEQRLSQKEIDEARSEAQSILAAAIR